MATADDFTDVVTRYQRRIYSLAWRMTGNHADADCLTQETFLKAYRKMEGFKGDADVGTWLWRIGYNTCVDFLKKKGRHRDAIGAIRDGTGPEGSGDPPAGEDASARAERSEERDAVWMALDELDPEDRAVITLTVMEGVTHRQAAEILDMPPGTVSWRVAETKKKLAGRLARFTGD